MYLYADVGGNVVAHVSNFCFVVAVGDAFSLVTANATTFSLIDFAVIGSVEFVELAKSFFQL